MLTATLSGKTGTAPGTTTLHVGPGPVTLVGGLSGYYQYGRYLPTGKIKQDPGVVVRNAYGELRGADLGIVLPTDFDMGRMRGYLPHMMGWLPGTITYQPDVLNLGQASPEETLVAHQIRKAAAEASTAEEKLRSERAARIWMVIGGLVGVGGLVVSVFALTRRSR